MFFLDDIDGVDKITKTLLCIMMSAVWSELVHKTKFN